MEIRIDKWLWNVRLYKTRAMAADACKLGRVLSEDMPVKPSRVVRVGDVYKVRLNKLDKTIRVKALLKNRVNAKLVTDYMEDLTPKEEYERLEFARKYAFEKRDRGVGRPTKKDRRDIEGFKN